MPNKILIWEWFWYFPLQLKILNHIKVPSKDCPATAANLWLRFCNNTLTFFKNLTWRCDFFLEYLMLISGKFRSETNVSNVVLYLFFLENTGIWQIISFNLVNKYRKITKQMSIYFIFQTHGVFSFFWMQIYLFSMNEISVFFCV